MKKNKPLTTLTSLDFEQLHAEAIDTLKKHLSQTKNPPNQDKAREWKKWKTHVEAVLELLKEQQKIRAAQEEDYLRELLEKQKELLINYGSIQTTTKAVRLQEIKDVESKKKKRKKKKNNK